MKFNDKVYDVLKWVCLIVLPSLTTFLLQVLPVFNVSSNIANGIATVLSAFSALIGALIGVSTVNYNKNKNE